MAEPDSDPGIGNTPAPRRSWRQFFLIAFAIAAITGLVALWMLMSTAGRTVEAGKDAVTGVIDAGREAVVETTKALTSEEVTRIIRSNVTEIVGPEGTQIEVAKLEDPVTISDTSEVGWLKKFPQLGRTTAEIIVPATFRYHIRLDGNLQVEVRGNEDARICQIIAPPPEPTLPVAFDSEKMEQKTTEGLMRFNSQGLLAELTKSITPSLESAADEKIDIARDTARRTIAEFVELWILQDGTWGDRPFSTIEVRFSDEVAGELPTLVSPL